MKLNHLLTAAAACALIGGAAYAQSGTPSTADAPAPGSRTGDWNGAHAPTDGSVASERIQPSTTTTTVTTTTTSAAPATDTATADVSATAADTAGTDTSATAPSATEAATGVSVTTSLVSNGPVPDTAENRAKYGGPMSRAGKMTAARGN